MNDMLQQTRKKLALLVFTVAVIFTTISGIIEYFNGNNLNEWISSVFQGFGTEVFGALLVLLVIDRTLHSLQVKLEKEREKDDLIFKLSNPNDNNAALETLRQLRNLGYVTDGSLRDRKLDWAQLQTADLKEADLRGANLGGANLQGASFWYANLQGAILGSAKLQKANLCGAKLQGADLHSATLTGVMIDKNTIFDEQTIMPDGNFWTFETDVNKFTQPKARASTGATRYA